MLLYVLATLCVSQAAGYSVIDGDFIVLQSDPEILSWPESYTVKATKLSLTSNLVEDFVAWKNNQSSRVDYNDGSVKVFKTLAVIDDDGEESIVKYEVHPETKDGEEPIVVCNAPNSDEGDTLDSILPDIGDDDVFEVIGNETITNKETVRFEYVDANSETERLQIIWAVYEEIDDEEYAWIPVRFEDKEYNSILGSLTKHEVWEFSEFSTVFEDDIFDADEYNCSTESVVKHAANSDKVLKELMFINPDNQKHVDLVFYSYIAKYQRAYAHEKEHSMRKAIFHQNMRLVAAVNRKNLGYKLNINQFSDRTPQELEKSRGLKRREPGKSGNFAFPYDADKLKEVVSELPEEYDSRLFGLVTPVKNQEDCGSCWTFGTTAAVEGALARVDGGRLMSLSNQALVDCVWVYGSAGCDGGTDNSAYEWMMDFGLPTEEEYGPYKNRDDYCHIENMTKIFTIRGYTDVTPFSIEATKVAVANHGPLSVSVNVSPQFHQYSGGIFCEIDCDPLALNHEVTMVGYGTRYGELFWILKNSWGSGWGIDGYMLISAKDNVCGVITEPTYAVL